MTYVVKIFMVRGNMKNLFASVGSSLFAHKLYDR